MFDLAMIALTCGSFAILILYTYACDRMWGSHDPRSRARRNRLARPAGLSGLRADPPRAVL